MPSTVISATPASGASARSSMRSRRTHREAVWPRPGASRQYFAAWSGCRTRERVPMAVDPHVDRDVAVVSPGEADLGARVEKNAVTFTIWAPRHDAMTLRLNDRDIPMEPRSDGYFAVTVPGARAGQRYWF